MLMGPAGKTCVAITVSKVTSDVQAISLVYGSQNDVQAILSLWTPEGIVLCVCP